MARIVNIEPTLLEMLLQGTSTATAQPAPVNKRGFGRALSIPATFLEILFI